MAVESVTQALGAVLQRASAATGVDFGFLMRTATRESGLNPAAHAQTSSAAGLFQFVEQTWLGALKRHGAKHGYGGYADLIQGGGDGKMSVAGAEARKAVMALRLDPKASALMAGELASENSAYLKGRVGREPTTGELYIAHFLGPRASADLIEASRSRPSASAAALFPEAAAANPAIFHPGGRAASVGELYANLTGGHTAAAAPAAATSTAATPAFLHHNVQARLARMEQERALSNMILGVDPGSGSLGLGAALGASPAGGGAAGKLTGALFGSELLTLLSQARQGFGQS